MVPIKGKMDSIAVVVYLGAVPAFIRTAFLAACCRADVRFESTAPLPDVMQSGWRVEQHWALPQCCSAWSCALQVSSLVHLRVWLYILQHVFRKFRLPGSLFLCVLFPHLPPLPREGRGHKGNQLGLLSPRRSHAVALIVLFTFPSRGDAAWKQTDSTGRQ